MGKERSSLPGTWVAEVNFHFSVMWPCLQMPLNTITIVQDALLNYIAITWVLETLTCWRQQCVMTFSTCTRQPLISEQWATQPNRALVIGSDQRSFVQTCFSHCPPNSVPSTYRQGQPGVPNKSRKHSDEIKCVSWLQKYIILALKYWYASWIAKSEVGVFQYKNWGTYCRKPLNGVSLESVIPRHFSVDKLSHIYSQNGSYDWLLQQYQVITQNVWPDMDYGTFLQLYLGDVSALAQVLNTRNFENAFLRLETINLFCQLAIHDLSPNSVSIFFLLFVSNSRDVKFINTSSLIPTIHIFLSVFFNCSCFS